MNTTPSTRPDDNTEKRRAYKTQMFDYIEAHPGQTFYTFTYPSDGDMELKKQAAIEVAYSVLVPIEVKIDDTEAKYRASIEQSTRQMMKFLPHLEHYLITTSNTWQTERAKQVAKKLAAETGKKIVIVGPGAES